jgi:hypothetical protein
LSRQRFIHPDFWTDPSLGKLTPEERLLFIGCFSNADDEGRLLGNPAYLRSTIFPYDDHTIQQIKDMRDHILDICKNIVLYEVDGFEYLAFIKWKAYQKPKYPSPSKFPPPPSEIGETFPQRSGNDSPNYEEGLLPRLGSGRDGYGMGMGSSSDGKKTDGGETPNFAAVEQEYARLAGKLPGSKDILAITEAFKVTNNRPDIIISAMRYCHDNYKPSPGHDKISSFKYYLPRIKETVAALAIKEGCSITSEGGQSVGESNVDIPVSSFVIRADEAQGGNGQDLPDLPTGSETSSG